MIQTIDQHNLNQEARRIRNQVSSILTKWGLLPRFKCWRLTQDPDTGMIVLFGVLNNRYIATHTSTPFGNYFDARLLHDLEKELQVQVVSCNSDGLRYAFILDRGQLGRLPTHIDYPFLDGDKLFVRVVYKDKPILQGTEPQVTLASLVAADIVDDQTLMNQSVGAFLKVFDDIKLKDDVASLLSAKTLPGIVVINEDEFNRRVAEHEAKGRRIKHIRKLLDETAG